MNKVKLDVMKPWITKKIAEFLKMDDDVVVEFVFPPEKEVERERASKRKPRQFPSFPLKTPPFPYLRVSFSAALPRHRSGLIALSRAN